MAKGTGFCCQIDDLQFFQPMLDGFEAKLSIPRAFLLHVEDDKSNKAVLTTLLGTWVVDIKRDSPEVVCFKEGWHEFVKAHDVSLGDFIFFQYKGDMNFDVRICDNTNCMKDYNLLAEEDATCMISQTTPSVKILIGPNNIILNEMPLPNMFRDSVGLSNKHDISIQDEEGRLWAVKLCHRVDGRVFLGNGWRDFVKANNIQATDYCTFTAISNDLLTTQISKGLCMQGEQSVNRSNKKLKGVISVDEGNKKCCSLCRKKGHYMRTCPIVKVQAIASENRQQ